MDKNLSFVLTPSLTEGNDERMVSVLQGRRHGGGGAAGAAAPPPPQLPAGPLFTEFAGTQIWRQKVMVTVCT